MTVLNRLQKRISEICDRFLYQPFNNEMVHCFQQECNEVLDELNKELKLYGVQAVLNDKVDILHGVVNGGIIFTDLNGNIIDDLKEYSPRALYYLLYEQN